MKIENIDNKLIVFLNKRIVSRININNKVELERSFQGIFEKLNTIYGLDINGSYEIVMYDNQYGLILDIKRKDEDFFDYYNTIDMNITVSKYRDILYKLINYDYDIVFDCNMYVYDGDIYIEPLNFDYELLGLLIENSEFVYGQMSNVVKMCGKMIDPKLLKVEKKV